MDHEPALVAEVRRHAPGTSIAILGEDIERAPDAEPVVEVIEQWLRRLEMG